MSAAAEEAAYAQALVHLNAARSGAGAAVQRERQALAVLLVTVSECGPVHLATVEALACWESEAQRARDAVARLDAQRTRVAAALKAWATSRAAQMARGAA